MLRENQQVLIAKKSDEGSRLAKCTRLFLKIRKHHANHLNSRQWNLPRYSERSTRRATVSGFNPQRQVTHALKGRGLRVFQKTTSSQLGNPDT